MDRISLDRCGLCEGAHRELVTKPLPNEVLSDSHDWTHWTICPVTGDLILVKSLQV